MLAHGDARSGFALTDCVALVLSAAILLLLSIAGLEQSRRHARIDEDLANLNRYGAGTQAFAADQADAIWSLSWEAGEAYEMLQLDGSYATVIPESNYDGVQLEAVHLIRLVGDRIGDNGMPDIDNIVTPIYYSHLPLMEYLGESPLAGWTASPADEVRQNWKDDPEGKFDQGAWLPLQPDPVPENRRWPYGSGYSVSPATWDFHQSELGQGVNGYRVQNSGTHNFFVVPGDARFGGRTMADVIYPSGKVHMHDSHQRHFGARVEYFAAVPESEAIDPPARLPILMLDGSASVRSAAASNPGWRPTTPSFPCMTFWYQPSPWEPPTTNGEFQQFCHGQFYWTRGGLKGLDYGGLPLETGQADPGECDL